MLKRLNHIRRVFEKWLKLRHRRVSSLNTVVRSACIGDEHPVCIFATSCHRRECSEVYSCTLLARIERSAEHRSGDNRLHYEFDRLAFVVCEHRVTGLRVNLVCQVFVDGYVIAGQLHFVAAGVFQPTKSRGIARPDAYDIGGCLVQFRALILDRERFGDEWDERFDVGIALEPSLPGFNLRYRYALLLGRSRLLIGIPLNDLIRFAENVIDGSRNARRQRISCAERRAHDER